MLCFATFGQTDKNCFLDIKSLDWMVRPQERPKTRKRMRRGARGGALTEGRRAKEAKTRQERRWTTRYWATGGRLRGGWLEATPASSLPATWLEAGVEVEIATCKVAGAHHLQAELIVAGQALHSQQILKCKHLIENLAYCDRVTLKMMNIVPPLNIQKKDIRLKKKTLKEPFFIKKSFLCID